MAAAEHTITILIDRKGILWHTFGSNGSLEEMIRRFLNG